MSKFKSFASQGSFRDYLLQAPDETAKIKEETAFKIKSKKEEMNWRQENNRIYLQAQRLVNSLEENNRETNFRLETENRQAFKDQLNEEYKLQVQADQQRASVEQRNLQNLSDFSKTAMQLGTQINDKITENQTKANASRAYAAGADYRTVVAIQGLTNNLTKAEFAQQDFIRDKLAEGGNVDAYFALYQARNTRGFINNVAVAQNSAYAFQDAARLHLAEYLKTNNSASIEEQRLAFRVFRDEYVSSFTDGNGRPLNPELLNSTVFPIIRQFETQILGEFDRQDTKAKEQERFGDVGRALNVLFANKGAVGVRDDFHTVDPSAQKRTDLAKWMRNRASDFGPNGLSSAQIYDIINGQYDGPNRDKDGNPIRVSMMEQFAGTDFANQLSEIYNNRRRAEISQHTLNEKEAELSTETEIQQFIDAAVVDGDGVFDLQELASAEKLEAKGPIGFKSKALEYARSNWTVKGRQALELDAKFQKKADAGTLTVADLTDAQGNYNVYKKFLPIAEGQDKWRQGSEFTPNMDAIDRMVANDPAGKIKAAPISGASNWTVKVKQNQMRQEYLKQLKMLNGDHKGAFAVVTGLIQAEQSVQGAIDNNGYYASVVKGNEDTLAKSKITLAERGKLAEQVASPEFGKDATKDANLFGPVAVYNSYDAMKLGKAPSPEIELGAQIRGVSKLEFMNYLAQGAGLQPITVAEQVQNLVENIKPTTRRLYNSNRTNERTERANYSNPNISRGNLPVRSSLAGVAPTGTNTGYQITDPRDGDSGVDFVIQNGQRGAPYYFPLSGKVLKVVNNMNEEYRLEEGDTRRSFGNLVEVQVKIPQLNNRVVDILIAHFDAVNDLKPGDTIPSNTLLGTQGRTGSTTGAHISFDCYVPGTNMPDAVCRDWFRNNHIK